MIVHLHTATVHKSTGEKFKISIRDRWETTGLGVVSIADIYRINNRPASGRILIRDSRNREVLICAEDFQGHWSFVSDLFIRKLRAATAPKGRSNKESEVI